jgi:hypothetical protein
MDHNPAFTAMEIYVAYNYNWMMKFTPNLTLRCYDQVILKPAKVTMTDSIKHSTGLIFRKKLRNKFDIEEWGQTWMAHGKKENLMMKGFLALNAKLHSTYEAA